MLHVFSLIWFSAVFLMLPVHLVFAQGGQDPAQEEEESDTIRDCEGEDLKGQTCRTLGFTGGVLRCNEKYEFDFSGCTKCGNRVVEPGEDCEPSRPLGSTCETEGFPGGTLGCRADCTFDTSQCSRWIRLEAGKRHACAQASDGKLWCWGDNASGQLGTGSAAVSGPLPVASFGTDTTAFAAGAEHTCALRAAGTVWCWGHNTADGRLGDGTTALRRGPTRVQGLDGDVEAIAAGDMHTCVLKKDRSVWCWGNNSFGQIGDGTRKDRYVPVRVDAVGSGVKLLAVGALHTCVLKKNDELWCWGDNSFGQLGDAPSGARPAPAKVANIRTKQAVFLAAGVRHTCLVYQDGKAACFGGVERVLEDGDADDAARPPVVQLQWIEAPSGRWERLSVGRLHACGRTGQGDVFCWGDAGSGQLGNGQDEASVEPVRVNLPEKSVRDVKTGDLFACALLQDGSVACWGDNTFGQAGTASVPQREKPSPVRGKGPFVRVFAGYDRTCAMDGAEKTWCWGGNAFGQLGDGTTAARTLPAVLAVSSVRHIAFGERHTCFLDTAGKVHCTGDGRDGQLGLGEETRQTRRPVQLWSPEEPAQSLCAGAAHTCALLQNGELHCWGDNARGQLGVGDTQNRFVPVRAVLEGKVSAVACGETHTCALKEDKSVWCWGDNAFGQLGDGSQNGRRLPVRARLPGNAVQLRSGGRHVCARLESGSVYCWGFNFYGQLGDDTTDDRSLPVPAALGTGLQGFWLSSAHGCVLQSGGCGLLGSQ